MLTSKRHLSISHAIPALALAAMTAISFACPATILAQNVVVQDFGAPVQEFGAPIQEFGVPVQEFNTPTQEFGVPFQEGTVIQQGTVIQEGFPIQNAPLQEYVVPSAGTPVISVAPMMTESVMNTPKPRRRTNTFAPPRTLAAGVLKEIPSEINARDSHSLPMPLPSLNLNKYDPQEGSIDDTLYGRAHRVIMYRDVWQYDFAFTGLRQAKIKTANADGSISKRNVWYMVYRVRDLGQSLTYEKVEQSVALGHVMHQLKQGAVIPEEKRYFLPRFSLEGWVFDIRSKSYRKVAYRDTIDPMAVKQIQNIEDPNQPLLDSVQMSKARIPTVKADSNAGVWGVAIWENIDPQIDYVSTFVTGLTNAYRIVRGKDDAISFKRKTLQLNFWRPGDAIEQDKDEIRFGIPLVDDPKEQVLITRRYDLPGPLIRGYEVQKPTDREVLIIEADGMVNLKTFKSALAPVLDKGNLPTSVTEAFANAGVSVNKDVGVETLVAGRKWLFKQGEKTFVIALEPQFWEPNFKGIRFIKSLDHIWIYR